MVTRIKLTEAVDTLYNISILLNGVVRSFPIHFSKEQLQCPVADIEKYFHDAGYKDARVMFLMKVKEIITVEQ